MDRRGFTRAWVAATSFTVAAWVKPTRLGGVRTIFRKRERGTSTFVLLTNGKDSQFVIRLASGRAAEVRASATLDTLGARLSPGLVSYTKFCANICCCTRMSAICGVPRYFGLDRTQ